MQDILECFTLSLLPSLSPDQKKWGLRLMELHSSLSEFEDPIVISKVLSILPPELQTSFPPLSDPGERQKQDEEKRGYVKKALRWFKGKFFSWVNSPSCCACSSNQNMRPYTTITNRAQMTQEEKEGGAKRVEVHLCNLCKQTTRFPRYNSALKLLDSRCGRCGEWAKAFCCILHAVGIETRFIWDSGDHVWTEVYLNNSWVHADSCENALDTPLMYEVGWNKKIGFVIALSQDHIVDVTRRYTRNWEEVKLRRGPQISDWLSSYLKQLNTALMDCSDPDRASWLGKALEDEEKYLSNPIRTLSEDEKKGRVSGSEEWRKQRGEIGKPAAKEKGTPPSHLQQLISHPSFSRSSTQLFLNGSSSLASSSLFLTPNLPDQAGSVWSHTKLPTNTSFCILFEFKVSKFGADGFAFVFQGEGSGALGRGGYGLGYDGIRRALAVEFDCYEGLDTCDDPDGNHISLQFQPNGDKKVSAHHDHSLACTPSDSLATKLSDGENHYVKILYDSPSSPSSSPSSSSSSSPPPNFSIFLDDMEKPVLCACVNTEEKLGVESVWVGFTGATGGISQAHAILGWEVFIDKKEK